MNKEEMAKRIEELEKENAALRVRASGKGNVFGRKYEVLEVLAEGSKSILEMSEELGIGSKNVSSQICYLKKEGWGIITDEEGRKMVTKYNGEEITLEEVKVWVEEKRQVLGGAKAKVKDEEQGGSIEEQV